MNFSFLYCWVISIKKTKHDNMAFQDVMKDFFVKLTCAHTISSNVSRCSLDRQKLPTLGKSEWWKKNRKNPVIWCLEFQILFYRFILAKEKQTNQQKKLSPSKHTHTHTYRMKCWSSPNFPFFNFFLSFFADYVKLNFLHYGTMMMNLDCHFYYFYSGGRI